MTLKLEFDPVADAMYVLITDSQVASTRPMDSNRLLDLDSDGLVVGIEFLNASKRIDLTDIPYHDQIAGLIWDKCDVVAVVGLSSNKA